MSWRLDPAKTGLVIVDLQSRILAGFAKAPELVAKARLMIQAAGLLGLPMTMTEQNPEKLGGTEEALLALGLLPPALAKMTFSAEPVLPHPLPKNLLIIGIETHVCIRQTVYDLRRRDHRVTVIGDAVASRRVGDHDLALAEMRADQVLVTSAEATVFELMGSAEHPQFRALVRLLK